MAVTKPRRNSRQRRIILEELRSRPTHPTAADLYETVRRRLPRISLATVYRNLDLLAADGVICRLPAADGGQGRFDGDPDRHYHVRCERCGKVDDVNGVPEQIGHGQVRSRHGFKITGHRLDFLGVCPECRSQRYDDEPADATEQHDIPDSSGRIPLQQGSPTCSGPPDDQTGPAS